MIAKINTDSSLIKELAEKLQTIFKDYKAIEASEEDVLDIAARLTGYGSWSFFQSLLSEPSLDKKEVTEVIQPSNLKDLLESIVKSKRAKINFFEKPKGLIGSYELLKDSQRKELSLFSVILDEAELRGCNCHNDNQCADIIKELVSESKVLGLESNIVCMKPIGSTDASNSDQTMLDASFGYSYKYLSIKELLTFRCVKSVDSIAFHGIKYDLALGYPISVEFFFNEG